MAILSLFYRNVSLLAEVEMDLGHCDESKTLVSRVFEYLSHVPSSTKPDEEISSVYSLRGEFERVHQRWKKAVEYYQVAFDFYLKNGHSVHAQDMLRKQVDIYLLTNQKPEAEALLKKLMYSWSGTNRFARASTVPAIPPRFRSIS